MRKLLNISIFTSPVLAEKVIKHITSEFIPSCKLPEECNTHVCRIISPSQTETTTIALMIYYNSNSMNDEVFQNQIVGLLGEQLLCLSPNPEDLLLFPTIMEVLL